MGGNGFRGPEPGTPGTVSELATSFASSVRGSGVERVRDGRRTARQGLGRRRVDHARRRDVPGDGGMLRTSGGATAVLGPTGGGATVFGFFSVAGSAVEGGDGGVALATLVVPATSKLPTPRLPARSLSSMRISSAAAVGGRNRVSPFRFGLSGTVAHCDGLSWERYSILSEFRSGFSSAMSHDTDTSSLCAWP